MGLFLFRKLSSLGFVFLIQDNTWRKWGTRTIAKPDVWKRRRPIRGGHKPAYQPETSKADEWGCPVPKGSQEVDFHHINRTRSCQKEATGVASGHQLCEEATSQSGLYRQKRKPV